VLGPFEGSLKDKVIFGEYLRRHDYAPHVIALFAKLFEMNGGGTFIDIGANIGMVAIPVSRTKNVTCIAFEPEPVNFACLRRNILRNDREAQIRPVNRAVYNEDTSLSFEISEENWGDHRIRVADASGPEMYDESARRAIKVRAARLDDMIDLSSITSPVAIKIDIQGAEVFAFRGGHKTLTVTEVMVSEFWPYGFGRAGASAEEFLDVLAPHFSFGTIIGHRVDAAGLLNVLHQTPLKPFAHLREELLHHAAKTPKVYTDILLSKTKNPFTRNAMT
jgi:FkbM family methyltransferase